MFVFCLSAAREALEMSDVEGELRFDEDGAVYAIKDANGDGEIDVHAEVSSFDFARTFQGSPALAPGVVAFAPCDGLAVYVA